MENEIVRVLCLQDVWVYLDDENEEPKLAFTKGETTRAIKNEGNCYDGLWEVHSWHKETSYAFYFTEEEFNINFKRISGDMRKKLNHN